MKKFINDFWLRINTLDYYLTRIEALKYKRRLMSNQNTEYTRDTINVYIKKYNKLKFWFMKSKDKLR